MDKELRNIVYDTDLCIEALRFPEIIQSFPNHFHDYYTIGYIEQGERNVSCNNKEYFIKAGDVTLFNPGDYHSCSQMNGNFVYCAMNISVDVISLIVFPHGSPSDPDNMESEQKIIDYFCTAYQAAFSVPVVYANSKGDLPAMMGKTGKMMQTAGFSLNGMSAIYDSKGIIRSTDNSEILCWSGTLIPQKRNKDIHFYGQDIIKGNFLFRKLILQPDTKKGITYYEKREECR